MRVEFDYIYHGRWCKKFLDISEIINLVRTGKYAKGVEALRKELMLVRSGEVVSEILSLQNIPSVSFANSEKGYTGYVMLSLTCKDEAQLTELRKVVNRYLQVLCSFKGASGNSLKVIMAFALADGRSVDTLNDGEKVLFHTNAYCRAVDFLQANTGIKGDGRGCNPEDGCRVSIDEEAYYNPHVVPVLMEMPTALPESQFVETGGMASLLPKKRSLPGYTEIEMGVTQFNMVRRNILMNQQGDDATEVITLAETCCKNGIDEEIAVKCTLAMLRFRDKDMLVRTAFERAYDEGKSQNVNGVLPKNVLNIELMQRFLSARYRFRQNELTGSVEYVEINRYVSTWKPFTERDRNTICMEALRAGIEVWDKDIKRYVNSTLIELYDPISEWIMNLPQWDGKDRVGELISTVKSDWEMWPEMFRVWLRSMVSQWRGMNNMYGATMVLMLTGKQGTGKSTFCKRLLPPELGAYYVDRLDFTNKKEAERALMRFCLINLDEYDQISPRQTAFLKHMLQKSSVMYRKMYQDDIEQRKRYAAFCATTNSYAPLTDPTGSRRYLVVEVTDVIDHSYTIDYQQLYAQVVYEIKHDQPSYFDAGMERMIQNHNGNYTEEIPLTTMFDNTFVVAPHRPLAHGEKLESNERLELTSTEILLELKERYKSSISINRSTSTQLGKYLSSRGIHSILHDGRRYYKLVYR